jgi:2,4-dienoyl-CoA reductase-like NADH-dependent reductase (Old Yellow Enzyme family)
LLQQGVADAAAFGKAYIANPDLVARFRKLSKGQSDV